MEGRVGAPAQGPFRRDPLDPLDPVDPRAWEKVWFRLRKTLLFARDPPLNLPNAPPGPRPALGGVWGRSGTALRGSMYQNKLPINRT